MSKIEFDVIIAKNVMVPLRDGVNLATDIYRPAKGAELLEGRFPSLLERTPYNKEGIEFIKKANYFTKRGYVFIVQDCRGRFESEGEFYGYANEPLDGYDTVEWIAEQAWSNGKIGTLGTSYMGWVQSGLAIHDPPHLTSMFPNVSIFNAGLHSVRHSGALEMRWLAWAFSMAADSKEASENPVIARALLETKFGEIISDWPIKKGQTPISLTPRYENFAFDILTHSDFDEFWRKKGKGWMGDVEEYIDDHSDVPMYYSGGWYDSYARSTLEFYEKMSKAKKSPVKLIMGPWTHGDYSVFARTYSGDIDFGSDASIEYNALRLKWFDQTMKGLDTGILEEPPIKIFVMGGGDGKKNKEGRLNHGGRWRYEHEWPLPQTMFTKYYLHDDRSLDEKFPQETDSNTSFVFDPNDPVPTIGGNLSSLVHLLPMPQEYEFFDYLFQARYYNMIKGIIANPLSKIGGYNQRAGPDIYGGKPPYLPLSSRQDVLVFQTVPLEESVEVTGPIKVGIYASSSALDTDFTAKLIDVYPPNEDYPYGYAFNLSDSIIRARYRNSFEKSELMEPDIVYQFNICLYPTSNLFQKGHRLRLDISSSNWPRFDVNPNTGEPLGLNTTKIKAKNAIYHDIKRPSHLILPIIPKK